MRRLSWLVAVVFSLSLLAGAPAWSKKHGDCDGKDNKKPTMIYKLARKKLELNDQKQSKLRELYFTWSMNRIDLKAQKKKEHLQLKRLVHQDEAPRGNVQKQIDRLYESKAALKKADMNFVFDMKDLLGDEQWNKLMTVKHRYHRMKIKKYHGERDNMKHRGREHNTYHDHRNHGGDNHD